MNVIPRTDPARIEKNLIEVRGRIARACDRAGRRSAEVRLVAVTKGRPPEDVEALAALGATDVGENRFKEAEAKAAAVAGVSWHMIGHLQRNKARKAVSVFSMLHSADSLELAAILDRATGDPGVKVPHRPFPFLVQVNVSGEDAKSGIEPGELPAFLEAVRPYLNISVTGLMTMAPFSEDPESSRPHFRKLAKMAGFASSRGLLPGKFELSMGMTGDFETAIEEGATIVRVGTALFA